MSSSNEVATFVLVKGSPEVIQSLAVPESLPEWYGATYDKMARQGLRVLALAYKRVHLHHLPSVSSSDEAHKAHISSILDGTSRHAAESDLHFCGFIAFECKVRADSGVVVRALLDSDHSVSMLTGDALLTSLHVAKKVSICDAAKECVTLRDGVPSDLEDASKYRPVWVLRHENTGDEEIIPVHLEPVNGEDGGIVGFEISESHMLDVVAKYNILATELEFFALAEMTGGENSRLWRFAGFVRVFARMSPPGKATVIRRVKEACKDVETSSKGKFKSDVHVMMCGDGGNDVGALKQADVGLALLVGHASSNTTEDLAGDAQKGTGAIEGSSLSSVSAPGGGAEPAQTSAEDLLNARDKALQKRSADLNKKRQEHMKVILMCTETI
jgi:cation-transporting ATPase 13A1